MTAITRRNAYIIATAIILIYSLIGYQFNIDVFKIMTIRKDGFSVSIVGVIICFITIYVLHHITRKSKGGK